MELFRADLHIHSRFSRATSKKLDLRLLAAWARVKGLDVLATGDFTHPEWMEEIEERLIPDGSGLFTLKDNAHLEREVPFLDGYPLGGQTRFMLVTEISSIYKRHGKTRKVHNLVFMPTLDMAKAFNQRLEQVGNLKSDGRPILGLDSHDLLEMVLETGPQAFMVPAHVWTPWFALFGSKSGFDSVEECFGDLSNEIFAMETGLSSDPEMNWMWSHLDRYRLISNSDAHSGEKLAREANLFSGEMSYEGIYRALRGEALGHKFLGTLEFFPEEGKYHLDGHRNCGVVMEPGETHSRGGLCPVCGKPLTVGVLNRIMQLADRDKPRQPADAPGFTSLVPLPEVISEVLGFGPNTKRVKAFYGRLIARFGSELAVLQDVPLESIAKVSTPLAEGIDRMRRGEVYRQPGFDGQYGTISVFTPQEKAEFKDGGSLVKLPTPRAAAPKPLHAARPQEQNLSLVPTNHDVKYNPAQQRAIDAGPGPVLVVAGPGTGKTQTLMARVARLLAEGETPRHILTLTFTRRAAGELSERLLTMRGESEALPRADTMHALAYECWTDAYGEAPTVLTDDAARRVLAEATGLTGRDLRTVYDAINLARERMQAPDGELADYFYAYTKTKESWNQADYTDLLTFWLEQIEADIWANPYTHILVDEVQDLSALQLALVKALACPGGKGVFAIGDPNQSIYSFRGAEADVTERFKDWWPDIRVIGLEDNYRSAQGVLDATAPLVPKAPRLTAHKNIEADIRLFLAPGGGRESAWIGERIRELIGSTSHSLADGGESGTYSPGDIAVLVRFKGLMAPLAASLDRLGLPCSVPEAEAFWLEPRVAAILAAAGRTLGIAVADADPDHNHLDIPERVLFKGPIGLAAYLQSNPPFDHLFWVGPEFRKLSKLHDECGGWPEMLNRIHLQSELDMVRAKAEKIQIMTLHAAKGLEFKAVFLPCLEDGILPFGGNAALAGNGTPDLPSEAIAEERRLLYVGMTRAKSRLYLSHAHTRDLYGKELTLPPSRYIKELPAESFAQTKLVGRKVRQEKQLGLLGE